MMKHIRIAALFGLVALLAGCSANPPLVLSSSVVAVNPAGPATAKDQPLTNAAAQAATQAETTRLLSLVAVPPDSVRLQNSPSSVLDSPAMGVPVSTSLILATKFWRVSMSLRATWSWFRANPPIGLELTGTGGASQQEQGILVWGCGFSSRSSAAWTGAGVDISMAPIDANNTAVRVDGLALWLDQTPLNDDQPGPRMYVTVADGCPASDQGYIGVTNLPPALMDALLPSQTPTSALVCRYNGMNDQPFEIKSQDVLDTASAVALAAQFTQLPLSHTDGTMTSCPMDDGAFTVVAFAFGDRLDFDLWVKTNGCATVANGFILTENIGVAIP